MNKHNRKALMMKKALLRLKGGKGSVLFFIIAIMTVMIVLASAVYYSTISARQQVEIKYGDEQSYQSAVALNDIVTQYLNTKSESAFVDAVVALPPLDKNSGNERSCSLTTQGSGTDTFAELASGLGDYKVTVTKVSGDSGDEKQTIKVETEVVVNGESSTVTSIGEFTLVSKPYSFDRFFTSTGYAPNDVFMSGMKVTSTMYLDNEYSQIGSDGTNGNNSGINILAEIISAGTLSINNAPINSGGSRTFDITVGNNLILTYNGGQGAMNLNGGRIRVGGNLIQGTSFNYKSDTDVYVVGDYISGRPSDDSNCEIYVNGDAAFFGNEQYIGKVYVNGDVFIDKDVNTGDKFPGGLTVGGNVYLCSGSSVFGAQKSWIKSHGIDDSRIFDYSDASIRFEAKNGDNASAYNALRASMDKARSLAGGTAAYNYVWPSDSGTCESLTNVKAKINEKVGNPEYSNWSMMEKFKENGKLYEPLRIELASETRQITFQPENEWYKGFNYIAVQDDNGLYLCYNVDTGKNERYNLTQENDQNKANCKVTITSSINRNFKTITPNDGVMDEKGNSFIVMGDVIAGSNYDAKGIIFDTYAGQDKYGNGIYKDIYVYLKANCTATKNDSGYTFTYDDPDNYNCFKWRAQYNGTADVGTPFHVFTKGKGAVIFVLPENTLYYAGWQSFTGHISIYEEITGIQVTETSQLTGMSAFSNTLASKVFNEKGMIKGGTDNTSIFKKYSASGEYIHNNIFLVAVDKNVSMNFDEQQNLFCGFIYAPYMTFNTKGTGKGGMIGGLIVSDYEMPNTSNTYFAAIPYDYYDRFTSGLTGEAKEDARFDYMEKLISNSGGEIGTIGSSSSRSWRKYGYN